MSNYIQYLQDLKLNGKQPAKKVKVKIKPYSDKRAKLNREYAKESRPFWQGKYCAVRSPVCQGKAQGIHHRKGKATPELLMDKTWWMPCCNFCNSYIENADAWARERGFKLSRM